MDQTDFTAAKIFHNANRFIEAYYTVLQPICRETGLPPMAVDILMFLANNPDLPTAGDICRCRGLKSGIVSVHVDRLVNEGLLRRLKVLRLRLAQQAGIPAFMVFSNATLEDMAAKAPRTMTAFLDVSGVGEAKAARYGDAFLELIREALPE